MSELFKVFLSLSFCASPFILLLLLCRPLFKNAFSKRWQYYAWMILLLRLLVPLAPPESPVGALFRAGEQALAQAQSSFPYPGEIEEALLEEAPSGLVSPKAESAGQDSAAEGGSFSQSPGISSRTSPPETSAPALGAPWWPGLRQLGTGLLQHLWLLWLGVAAALLVRKITVYQSFCAYIRVGSTEVADIALLERLARLEGQLHVRRPIELSENAQAASPMLLGFFRPCIVLPCARLPQEELDCTLLHELTHYRRRDMLYRWGMQLALCLHWFNPLVWRMGREVARACELSCDEAVIRAMDVQGRRAYGDTLLRAMQADGPSKSTPAAMALGESAKLMKERLEAIMAFKKRPWWVCGLSILLAFSLALGAAAAGAYTGPAAGRKKASPVALGEEADAKFYYTQQGYYQPPYLFEIGWNLQEQAAKGYTHHPFTVWDEEKQKNITLDAYFAPECARLIDDAPAMQALSLQLSRLYLETRETAFPAVRFLVASVSQVGDTDAGILAERCYENGELPQFGAVFAWLDGAAQEAWLERMYADGRIAFFAASLDQLKTEEALVARLAETAYADGAISFFSVLAGHMDSQAQERWYTRAGQDGRVNFRAVLLDLLSDSGQAQPMREELDKLKQELDKMKQELAERQEREYAAHGITQSAQGGRCWQGQLIRVFQDIRANGAFQTLAVNPRGTVDIKITRGADGEIVSVGRMPAQEAEALLADMEEPEEDWEDDWDWEDGWEDTPDWLEDDNREKAGLQPVGGEAPTIETLDFKGKSYYLVNNEAQLRALASGAYGLDKHYLQQADITLSPQEWVPIGTDEQPFTGSYNGNGFEIIGLTMTDPQARRIGMFGAAKGAEIYNITLRDYDIESAGRDVAGKSAAPVLAVNLAGSRCYDIFLYPKPAAEDKKKEAGASQAETVTRLAREELPEAVEKAMAGCEIRRWYVIRHGGRQYLWYNGMAFETAYRPQRQEDGWTVDILRMKKKDSGYLLLSLPDSGKLTVTLDGEPAACTVLNAGE